VWSGGLLVPLVHGRVDIFNPAMTGATARAVTLGDFGWRTRPFSHCVRFRDRDGGKNGEELQAEDGLAEVKLIGAAVAI